MRFFDQISEAFQAASTWVGGYVSQGAQVIPIIPKTPEPELPLTILLRAMTDINQNSDKTLREKKSDFIRKARLYIPKLNNEELAKLYHIYKNDFFQEKRYAFIYAEDTEKPIGWVKQTIFRQKEPVGNTNTHKYFLFLLKKQALDNIEKNSAQKNYRLFHDKILLQELMAETRGRLPNVFSFAGAGLEGDFRYL